MKEEDDEEVGDLPTPPSTSDTLVCPPIEAAQLFARLTTLCEKRIVSRRELRQAIQAALTAITLLNSTLEEVTG